MKLYLGSNRILGGACSINFGPMSPVRFGVSSDGLRIHLDVHGQRGERLGTCVDGVWSNLSSAVEAVNDDTSMTLLVGDRPLVRLLVRQRFVKLVSADIYGPQGERILIGSDGALRLLGAAGQPQVEVSECEFIGEAHFASCAAGALGDDTVQLHGSGVSYTVDAVGQRILNSEFTPSDAAAAMAAAGMSLN